MLRCNVSRAFHRVRYSLVSAFLGAATWPHDAEGVRRRAAIMASDDRIRNRTITRAELLDAVHDACPTLTRGQARSVFEMASGRNYRRLHARRGGSIALIRRVQCPLETRAHRAQSEDRRRKYRSDRARVVTFKASPVLTLLAPNNMPFAHLESKSRRAGLIVGSGEERRSSSRPRAVGDYAPARAFIA